jgi:hypothetical protein
MKRFFTLMAAMLVCVSGMLAAVAYTLEVVAPEHATITAIQINDAEWTGETVEADDTLTVSLQAEPLYEFGEGTGNTTLTFDTVLSSDLADDDAKFTITCPAPTIMQVYFVHFNGGWHFHLDSVWLNDTPMLENDFMVREGDYVEYRYRADEGYEFAVDITTYQSGFTLSSPTVDYGDTIRFVCSYNKAVEIPRYVLLAEEPAHATLTLKVNSQPFENGGIVMPHDTLFYQYVLDYGYEFDNGDTAYTASFVIERFMPQNDTLRIRGYADYIRITPPSAMIDMLDSTTAYITWTGIFTESKVLITPVELNQDPRYAKGMTYVNSRELTVDTLTPGQYYYLYIVGTKPEMSGVFETTFRAIYTEPEDFNWEPADDCEFIITMNDRWGDGWNGNALRFVEDGNVQTITLTEGSSGTATYQSSAKPVSIYWVKGSYADEVSCTVADATGRPLLTINSGDAEYFAPGQLLFRGTLCWACAAKVQSLTFDVDSADFRIDWTGPDGVSYDVAITQKSNPTDADLEAIAFRQDSTSYIWTGKPWMGYNAYVRAICDDTVPGAWAHAFVFEGLFDPTLWAMTNAKSIELDYTETGDMLQNAAMGSPGRPEFFPILPYRLNLTDTTDVVFSFRWENLTDYNNTYVLLFRDTTNGTGPWERLGEFYRGDTLRNLWGNTYIMVLNEGQLDEYTLSLTKPKYLTAKPIDLGYTETGDFTEALPWPAPLLSGECPTHLFSYTPTDSVVNVIFEATTNTPISFSSMPSMAYFVFQDTLDLNHLLAAYVIGTAFVAELQKGHTYYFAVCLCPDAGGLLTDDYTVTLKQAQPLVAKTITLPYTESGDYTDAVDWSNPYFGMSTVSKAFAFTPTDTVDVLIHVSGDNAPSAAGIFTFRGNLETMISGEACPTMTRITCLKDSTYIFVLSSIPIYGGKPTDTYQISFSELTEKTEPKVTAVIEPDTIVSGLITEDDFVSSTNQLVRVYEYVAYKEEHVALGLFLTDTLPGMSGYMPFSGRIYKDTLDLNGGYTYFDDDMSTLTLFGSAEGTHYYIAIVDYSAYSLSGLPFNLHFRREMDYDNPNVLATVEVGQLYTSEMTLFDEFTYHDTNASAQSFRFHAEKGKNYKLYMHLTYCRYNTNEIAISVLNPLRKKGTYGGNLVSAGNGETSGWFVTNFTPDSTGDYVAMFEHQLYEDYMAQDTLRYEFLITDYIEFIDLINSAEYVATPYIESGSYTSASTKVLYNDTYKFQGPSSDAFYYNGGIYNAKAYMVIVPAGDTLLIEHGGDKDVMIYVYDFSSEDNAKSPRVIDEEGEGYPFEISVFVNTNRMAKMYYVVITEYDTELDGGEWSLRIELGMKNLRQQDIAKGVASQDKITIYNNQGELEAIAALSALDLSAVDAATGATIATIRNNSAYWQVDLLNNKARFEANESDLPVGYRFAEATEWIEVAIEVLPYGEGIDNVDEDKTFEVRKFLYNGHIYIQTPNGIFNITGQRVK